MFAVSALSHSHTFVLCFEVVLCCVVLFMSSKCVLVSHVLNDILRDNLREENARTSVRLKKQI